MLRDPLYRDIVDGLSGRLDPELFERCAAALVGRELPIVPIRGGADAGMDAAVADARGLAYPMVVTTAEDVIGNLTKSLKSYLKASGPRRRVVLVTSRQLTPTRRKNLEKRAAELRFELVQVYDQSSLADRLYGSPEWCQELLSLTSDPPALSVLPRNRRPLLGSALIGRRADSDWLRESEHDCLLAGQPGSGKTFLLYSLTREGWGLFVVSDDIARIAGGIRREGPQIVIVDDAHANLRVLTDLRHLRDQTGAQYRIVATSWIGEHESVADALSLSASQVRRLEPLTRDEIVEVINECGLRGPTMLVREIVDQAAGRAGLAATLTHLCLGGGTREVVLGEALQHSYRSFLQPLIGRHAIETLACFAVGGSAGMEMSNVSDFLKASIASVRETLVQLAAAGLVTEVPGPPDGGSCLAVEPRALREVLLRDVFFSGPARLPYQEIAATAPDTSELALALLGARRRGASVQDEFLRSVVEAANTVRVWESYAYLGPDEAKAALAMRPDLSLQLAHPALLTAPEAVIPRLLSAAAGDGRALHSTPEHPFRLIQDWVKEARPGTAAALQRRTTLVAQAREWLSSGRDSHVGDRALCLALWPGTEQHETDPGMGMRLTLRWGLLSGTELEAIGDLWDEILESLSTHLDSLEWGVVLDALGDWVYPGRHIHGEVPEDVRFAMEAIARRMLDDLAALAGTHHGILRRLSEMASDAGVNLRVDIDSEFLVLFPIEDLEHWQEAEVKQQEEALLLASRWCDQDPETVVDRMLEFERQASAAGIAWPRWTPSVCNSLAKQGESPLRWACALLAKQASADLVFPFLEAAVAAQETGWTDALGDCMDQPLCRAAAVSLVLTMPASPSSLLDEAMGTLSSFTQLVHTLCLRGEVPNETLRRLLTADDVSVATAAATGEWSSAPQGQVRNEIALEWEEAMLQAPEDDYWVGEILSKNSVLALRWLQRFLTKTELLFFLEPRDTATKAMEALDQGQKLELLATLSNKWGLRELADRLVADDPRIFQALLARRDLADLHLGPLAGRPTAAWPEKAALAVAAGYSPDEVGAAAFTASITWTGDESAMWGRFAQDFSPYLSHRDNRVRESAAAAVRYASEARERALMREREEAVRGLEDRRRS